MMFTVKWRGSTYEDEELEDLFAPILTSEGICYTFNIMDRSEVFTKNVAHYTDYFSTNGKLSEWSVETGYSEKAGTEAYPKRTIMAGVKGGLSITFLVNGDDLDFVCGDSLQGFKITLHHPGEIPRVKQKYLRVPLDHSIVASIKPNMMTTADGLVSYKPEDRQCYFSSEKSLKFFNSYNQQNCLLECLTDFCLDYCGCVAFQMPRENSTPICGAINLGCTEQAKAKFLESEVAYKIQHSGKNSKNKDEPHEKSASEKCNCLPSCASLDFDLDSSQSAWDWKEYLKVESQTSKWNAKETRTFNNSHFSRLVLFFKEMQFMTSERNELYGQTEFFANCGGLLGLCMGFSVISAFEIVYYLTLRIVCNLKKYGRRYWSGSEELLESREESKNKNDQT
ncbi:hypothetical protein ILUMI_02374 [Ignelater luminosus]|uniref:Pickpocket protein 28 n=1 Tax=Ignelater luminosus TaxID=2038154 RepID=A0A8K0DHR9_IGNLU|nr:hypothetical protein ILUMI_02374 [Ignelater luminosus]